MTAAPLSAMAGAMMNAWMALAVAAAPADFAPTQTAGGKKLVLNGTGTRQATIFNIDVYAAGLYLETVSHDAAAVLASPQIKKLDMRFLRDVPADKMREGWMDAIARICEPATCVSLKAAMERLNALITKDLAQGDVLGILFTREAVELSLNGAPLGRVVDSGFAQAMPAIWLGANPPNASLKSGLLGN